MSKSCPKCQAKNLDDAAFCDNCGEPLPTAAAPAPVAPPPAAPQAPAPSALPPAPLQPQMGAPAPVPGGLTCASCGVHNEIGAAFCENCGAPLKPAPAPIPSVPAAPPPPPQPPVLQVPAAPPEPTVPVSPPIQPTAPVAVAPQPTAPVAPVPQPTAPVATPSSAASTMIAAVPGTTPPAPGHPRLQVVSNMSYFDLFGRTELLVGRVDPISGIFPEIDLTAHGGDEGGVSRRHCKITLAGNQFFIEDLNSSNGTYVNATRITPGQRAPIENGWQLRLGKVVLNFYAV